MLTDYQRPMVIEQPFMAVYNSPCNHRLSWTTIRASQDTVITALIVDVGSQRVPTGADQPASIDGQETTDIISIGSQLDE